MKTFRYVLAGLGNVGRRFLEIAHAQEALLAERHRLKLVCVAAIDRSGALADPKGLDPVALAQHKSKGGKLSDLGAVHDPAALIELVQADLLLEATPTDLKTGGIALTLTRRALERGMHAVLASKGPLVLDFEALASRSDLRIPGKPMLRFSGAAASALPTVNLGRRDLAGAAISRLEAVLNQTSQMLLGAMSAGQTYEAAMAEARRMGVVETDPSLDVGGWDAANKLVIIANAVLGISARLKDVSVAGIEAVRPEQLAQARETGVQVTLLATAIRAPGTPLGYTLRVAPAVLALEHPLARIGNKAKGITYQTDLYGEVTAISRSEGAGGASASMLRDVLEIAGRGG